MLSHQKQIWKSAYPRILLGHQALNCAGCLPVEPITHETCFTLTWASLRDKVSNVPSRCHTKRMMVPGAPILLLVWQRLLGTFLYDAAHICQIITRGAYSTLTLYNQVRCQVSPCKKQWNEMKETAKQTLWISNSKMQHMLDMRSINFSKAHYLCTIV